MHVSFHRDEHRVHKPPPQRKVTFLNHTDNERKSRTTFAQQLGAPLHTRELQPPFEHITPVIEKQAMKGSEVSRLEPGSATDGTSAPTR